MYGIAAADVCAFWGASGFNGTGFNALTHLAHLAPLFLQVQALRSIEKYLGLETLYVLGTNCVDNGPRQGLDTFLKAASETPETVLHYEFVQDYRGATLM